MERTLGAVPHISEGLSFVSLQRFAATAPQLRQLMQTSGGGEKELLVRAALRRALRELSEAVRCAAGVEDDPMRAAELRGLSKMAAELASTVNH
jgi:hypothetical protein